MLVEQMKAKLVEAMKQKNETQKNILRVVLGDVETAELRSKKKLSDDAVQDVIYKRMDSNIEVINIKGTEAQHNTLKEEIDVLQSFVPVRWNEDKIEHMLSLFALSEILGAKADGQAIGLARAKLTELGATYDGKVVKSVVEKLRAEHVQS